MIMEDPRTVVMLEGCCLPCLSPKVTGLRALRNGQRSQESRKKPVAAVVFVTWMLVHMPYTKALQRVQVTWRAWFP